MPTAALLLLQRTTLHMHALQLQYRMSHTMQNVFTTSSVLQQAKRSSNAAQKSITGIRRYHPLGIIANIP